MMFEQDSVGGIELSVRRDDAYLREHYRQWWLHRSGWRRWLWLASLVLGLIAVAVAFSAATTAVRLPAVVIAAMGLAQSIVPWLEFRRWKQAALGGLETMPDLRLSMHAGIRHFGAGPSVRYVAGGEVIRVPGGVFVYERGNSGRHVYLPALWMQNEGVRNWLANIEGASGSAVGGDRTHG